MKDYERGFYRDLGGRIASRRKALGFTQAQVAEHLRLTRQSIANVEGGRQAVSGYDLVRLVALLNLDLTDTLRPDTSWLQEQLEVQAGQMAGLRAALRRVREVVSVADDEMRS